MKFCAIISPKGGLDSSPFSITVSVVHGKEKDWVEHGRTDL